MADVSERRMAMRVYLDECRMDTGPETVVSVSLSVAALSDLERSRTGYSRTIELPMTVRNRQVVGYDGGPGAVEAFNREAHTARIEQDGSTILSGAPCLLACVPDNGAGGCYRIALVGASGQWAARLAGIRFPEVAVAFSERISGALVQASWTWDKPVRFLPVQRDGFVSEPGRGVLFDPVRVLSFEDYHPFLHVRTVLEALFGQAGYAVRSEFVAGELFGGLYMSGNYPMREVEPLRRRMDFCARRFASAEATADRFGRVYADPMLAENSVGNIVDTADPGESRDGVMLEGVYAVNGCFRREGPRICFVPTEPVTLGFEYALCYTTEYYLLGRDELRCFDTVLLSGGDECRYRVPNRSPDRREVFRAGRSYKIVVFGHVAGAVYQFRYDDGGIPVVPRTFSARVWEVDITAKSGASNPRLWVRSGAGFVPYGGDWALYDAYVQERGTITVELKLRSRPERVLPSQPKYFDALRFSGAEPGMKLTLGVRVALRPLFAPRPCRGSVVDFAGVAAHEISGLDFVRGLKHLFNLCFYTDETAREVFIEPREEFYRRETVIDWSGRIDLGRPVLVEELGVGMPERVAFQYREGDGAVARWDEEHRQKLGRWRAGIENRFTERGERRCVNPVFCPSLDRSGVFPGAAAASLLQVGDRDRFSEAWDENLDFPAKIVRYFGMEPLPGGQLWGWPSYGGRYPLVAFHRPERDFSLCFEDREGVQGLHRHYDRNFELYNRSCRLTLWLDLRPEEVEQLARPDGRKRDFRALYRLGMGGEHALYRLEEVCDYRPGGGPAKCLFIKEI